MLHTLSPEDVAEALEMNDMDIYSRGLSLPAGEGICFLMDEALQYLRYDMEIPLDLAAQLMVEGVHVDDFVQFVQSRIDVDSDTFH